MKRTTLLLGQHGLLTDDWRVLPLTEMFNEFIKSIPENRPHTARAYRSDCNFLLAFMGHAKRIERLLLGDRTSKVLTDFVAYRAKHGDAPGTIARRMNCQRSFDSWFKDYIPSYPCPTRDVRAPEQQRLAFEGITPDDAKKLKAAAHKMGLLPALCLELLLGTGLRRQEILDLTEGQLDARCEWFLNVRCKGDYYRDVPIPAHVRPLLMRWMNERDRLLRPYRLKSSLPYPLLVSIRGAVRRQPETFRMDPKTLWRMVRDAARKAVIAHVHPHKCRHARAHEIMETSKDIRLVAQGLGHKSLATTVRYTERSHENLAEQLEAARR